MRRLIAATAAGALLGLVMFAEAGPAAAQAAPYTDPMATGYIGFCDAHGKSIQSGSLDAVPFVAKAISSSGVQAPYNALGSSAWLNAYQPRQGVTPPEWSGEQLISASLFSTAAHPAVVGTKGDISLRQFVQDAPPQWDGFVQLRMYVKAPTSPYDALHYAATDIQVSGNSWHVVRGGNVSCNAGTGRSIGALLAPSAAAGKYNQPVKPEKSTPGVTPSTAGSSGGNSTTSAGIGGTDAGQGSTTAEPSSGSSFPTGYVVLGALIAVLAIALLMTQRQKLQAVLARRRDSTDAT